jgi:hypothetical protein
MLNAIRSLDRRIFFRTDSTEIHGSCSLFLCLKLWIPTALKMGRVAHSCSRWSANDWMSFPGCLSKVLT